MAKHIILRNLKILHQESGGYLGGTDDVQILGGEIGWIDPNDGLHMNKDGGGNTKTLIDGLYMQDLTHDRDASVHTDCVRTGSATSLAIRNSRFVNCATQGVFLSPYNGGEAK